MKPAIIVIGFNRPQALERLLTALSNSEYPEHSIPLYISIDQSGTTEVKDVAEAFEWKFGTKEVLVREQHLGLKAHVLACGDLIAPHGSAIFLEDDLLVSPHFYPYASRALRYYDSTDTVAGISLYSYDFTENGYLPFQSLDDGSGVYFMQMAASWGQAWTTQQWQHFSTWLADHPSYDHTQLPGYTALWGNQSWKRHFIQFLQATDRYFVFPNTAFSTNFEDAGTHASSKGIYQVPLELSNAEVTFTPFDASETVYDAWFELLPRCLNKWAPHLATFDYAVDLYGQKLPHELKRPYALTTKKGTNPVKTFSGELYPLPQNVILQVPGNSIQLTETAGLSDAVLPPLHQFFRETKVVTTVFGEILRHFCSLRLLIPITELSENALETTLKSVAAQQLEGFQCVLLVDKNQEATLRQTMGSFPAYAFNWSIQSIAAAGNSEDLLLHEGIRCNSDEVVTWLRPGSKLLPGALLQAQRLFATLHQVRWVLPFSENNSVPSFVPLHDRLNYYLLHRNLMKGKQCPSTEGMFWRHGVLVTTTNTCQQDWVLQTIKTERLYPLLQKLVSLDSALPENDVKNTWELEAPSSPSFSWRIIASILRSLEGQVHTQYLHDLYGLLFDLPEVIRHDITTNTFHLRRY